MLTIESYPTQVHKHIDAIFGVKSTRALPGSPVAIASIGNSGGKLSITTVAAHNLESADIITINGVNGLPRNKSKITVLNATQVKCDDIDAGSYTVSGGYILKSIANVKIMVTVNVGSTALGAYFASMHSAGVFQVSPGEILANHILKNQSIEIENITGTYQVVGNQIGAGVAYTLTCEEYMNNAYDRVEKVVAAGATLTTSVFYAHYCEDEDVKIHTSAIKGGWLRLSREERVRPGELKRVEMLAVGTNLKVVRKVYMNDGSISETETTVNPMYGRVIVYVSGDYFTANMKKIELSILAGANRSEEITLYKSNSSRNTMDVISCINYMGGKIYYYPPEIKKVVKIDSKESYDANGGALAASKKKVTSGVVYSTILDDIEKNIVVEVITSPIIGINGKRANCLNTSLTEVYRTIDEYELEFNISRK